MIGPDRMDRISAEAIVPEQVIAYACSVGRSQPLLFGACVGYASEDICVLIGYPLHDPMDNESMSEAVDLALKRDGLRKIIVIGPSRPPQAPEEIRSEEDGYYFLPVPAPTPSAKLKNLLRRADRELTVFYGRRFYNDHQELVNRYLSERILSGGTGRIFRRIPDYLESSPDSLIVSARRADGRLAAFSVGEYTSMHTAFFMFCFRDATIAPPGSADLVFSGLLEEAARRGHIRMNLGLGVNEGIRFFKRKWGARFFLPCVETAWEIQRHGIISRLRRFLDCRTKDLVSFRHGD